MNLIPEPVTRKRKVDQFLSTNYTESHDTGPRFADGRTNRRTPQNHVSVTVVFQTFNELRVKREELALPNAWINEGKIQRTDQQVRRGDIAFAPVDYMQYAYATGLCDVPAVTTFLNNWPKSVPLRVIGIVDNPSVGRGQPDHKDNIGNLQMRGVNTIVNTGSYVITCEDIVYALWVPEVIYKDQIKFSMNAIKGAGDNLFYEQDLTQKLIPQLIPLRFRDVNLLIDHVCWDIDERVQNCWAVQANDQSVNSKWTSNLQQLRSVLAPEVIMMIPGMKDYAMMHFYNQCLARAMNDYLHKVDFNNTCNLLRVIYKNAHEDVKAYWNNSAKEFSGLHHTADLIRLAGGSGNWLIPSGINTVLKLAESAVNVAHDLKNLELEHGKADQSKSISQQKASVGSSAINYVSTLQKVLEGTMGWILSSDISAFFEYSYVGICKSAQAVPGQNMDILR